LDTELQAGKKNTERNIRLQRKDSQEICQDKKGKKEKPGRRQQERPSKITDADQLKITVGHFFGDKLNKWIDEINDPRAEDQCVYKLRHLVWLGLVMFILRLESRRQLTAEKETESFRHNLLGLTETDEETVAHSDTVNYAMERIVPAEIEAIKVKMVKQLILDKRLDQFRLFGEFCIAVDGTGIFSFPEKHCDQCLKTEHSSGKVTWSHKMLEAKLVSENGFAMSVCSESIENPNGVYEKQDCELKAFYRLADRLKSYFPRTPICLLLDSLYACKEVFRICKQNGWSFIIAFKEGSIPNLYAEVVRKKAAFVENALTVSIDKNQAQNLSWAHHLTHDGFILHALFCKDIKPDKNDETEWVWLTDRRPNADNVYELVNKGGRQRWKIENQGFDEQKRHGFELEHLYGRAPNAWKNYYQIMQIAHIITQLIIHGDLCQKLQTLNTDNKEDKTFPFLKYYQSIRNFIRRLSESFRNFRFSDACERLTGKIQIRFNSA
jgi:hypothetical protein